MNKENCALKLVDEIILDAFVYFKYIKFRRAKCDLLRTFGKVTTAKSGNVCPSIIQNHDEFQPDCMASHPRRQYSNGPASPNTQSFLTATESLGD